MSIYNIIFKGLIIALISPVLCGCHSGNTNSQENSAQKADTSAPLDTLVQEKEFITFALTGDMMMGTDYPETPKGAYLPVDSGRHLLDDCREITQRVDVAAGQLEGVLGHGGTPKICNNPSLCFTFRMPGYYKHRLAEAGFDYMNLANNHMADFGKGGLESSMKELESVGIAYGGVKKHAPYAIIERDGLKIGLTGFSTSELCPSVLSIDELKSILAEMRPKCDIIVVSMHAGAEGSAYAHVPRKEEIFHSWPRGDVYKFAHTAIDNGADIVWGHGPHVLRGAEVYKDRLILYSLGNFCTPYRMGIVGPTGQAALAEVKVDRKGKFVDGKIHSYIQQRGKGPVSDPNNASAKQIKSLSEADFSESPLKISNSGELTY